MLSAEYRYRRLQAIALRCPGGTILVFIALFMLATYGLTRLQLDLSFRPLFASGSGIADATLDAEWIFGQSSGAWIVAIVENNGGKTNDDIRTVARLSTALKRILHVTEVLSITSVAIPEWRGGKLSLIEPVPEWVLDPEEDQELSTVFESLLDGTRFVKWLISADGQRFLVAARVDLPLDDLNGRRKIVDAFRETANTVAGDDVRLHFTGVTVVELAYEQQVLRDQIVATALTTLSLIVLLFISFGNVRPVLICLLPVSLAIPATLGIMGWIGQPVSIINSAIPAIVLVVGVADAVHMLTAWLESRGQGRSPLRASRHMIVATGLACFLTTATTVAGFLSLTTAKLDAVAGFGLSAAVGIVVAWIVNQMLVPLLLRYIDAGRGLPDGLANTLADNLVASSIRFSLMRPRTIVVVASIIGVGCAVMTTSLRVDQKFNEELGAEHPVTLAQTIMETDFGGFLGPEVSIRSVDGNSMLADDAMTRLDHFLAGVRDLPDTHQVFSVRDLLSGRMTIADRSGAIAAMRASPALAGRTHELISPDEKRLSVLVRIGDIGTNKAAMFRDDIEHVGIQAWGGAYEVDVVGQWWLSQHGMRLLLRDMLTGLFTAILLVLPILWLALRDRRLFIAAAVANMLPLLVPLAFMAATGLVLRIGTAVVLAIALGITVDNTLHIIIRLRSQMEGGLDLPRQMQQAMHGTGRAIVFTTLALVGGFLSMMGNELLAIRDMGLVAAVAFTAAMLADLLLLPAVYVLQGVPGKIDVVR